ncbi:hypothetical protein EUTSA_v10009278mg [Eutrema salsugineum]|uniref:Uncharacterized protein n=1 Tax=Eutrema salsugineum TaxID=72664 RepID=V4MWA0_EUTSA|nr:hypothetical protein EUTSA_v10009278mg [Eutrema salsugineum]
MDVWWNEYALLVLMLLEAYEWWFCVCLPKFNHLDVTSYWMGRGFRTNDAFVFVLITVESISLLPQVLL